MCPSKDNNLDIPLSIQSELYNYLLLSLSISINGIPIEKHIILNSNGDINLDESYFSVPIQINKIK